MQFACRAAFWQQKKRIAALKFVIAVTVILPAKADIERVKGRRLIAALLAVLAIGIPVRSGQDGSGSGPRASPTERLREMVDSGRLHGLRWPEFPDLRMSLQQVYATNGYKQLWSQEGGGLSSRAQFTLSLLREAARKGLQAEDYDTAVLESWAQRDPDSLRTDLGLSVALMRYASALHQGRVDPRLVRFAIKPKDRLDTGAFLLAYLHASEKELPALLAGIEPPFRDYQRLQEQLGVYMERAAQPQGRMPAAPRKPLKPGDRYSEIAALRERLILLGDWKSGTDEGESTKTYAGKAVDAVKSVQRRHGLAVTGVLDGPTYKALSTPLAARIEQIQLTLERWRWLPGTVRPAIIVNIPEFELRAFNEDRSLALRMHVIVGKAYRHRTPVFEDELENVIVRPYWNVPLSIQRNEIVPALRKNPGYLARHDMQVVDQGNRPASAEPGSGLLAKLASGQLHLRQRPGPSNSLGLLKLDFPNAYDVYMHGTPAQALFSRMRRDFSHGCIRVADSLSLATWVLRDVPGWGREEILAATEASQTIHIPVRRRIAVLVLYGTAVAEEDGAMRFYDDLYGYDAELRRALAHGYPYRAGPAPVLAGSGAL